MIIRFVIYAVLLLVITIAAIWLAFGPGVSAPLRVLLGPGDWLLYQLNPGGGSNPSVPLLEGATLSCLIWLAGVALTDLAVTRVLRKMRHGG
jgi:hypothetical protein